ncbi:sugar nucleotide-binding protein [Bosea sp. R86505]|uniref:sugar nucleotide-binding protein n=1 Tax=Bosea sp. R86505 TaxID=3101710 RepID=UPI00366B6DDF
MAHILILGADGSIGRHMAGRLTSLGHAVTETTRRAESVRPGRILADFADPAWSATSLPAADMILICAAMARFADCRERPDIARRVNVDMPAQIGARARGTGSRVVLLSTSAVFDCLSPLRKAEDAMAPASAYGRMKAEAEEAFLALGPATAVLRLTKVLTPDMALLTGWVAALKAGSSVRAFADMTVAPITLADVEAALLALLADGGSGRYQVSAADDVSYAAIARHLAQRLAVDESLVEAVGASSAGIPDNEIMRYTSLDTRRLQAISRWRPSSALAAVDRVFPLP